MCVVCAACAAPDGRPPIARIAVTPTAIPVDDNFQTTVMLDGTASALIETVDAGDALTFAWQLDDDVAQPAGALDQPTLTATFAGARPPRIVLTVTAHDGEQGSVTHELDLTVPNP